LTIDPEPYTLNQEVVADAEESAGVEGCVAEDACLEVVPQLPPCDS